MTTRTIVFLAAAAMAPPARPQSSAAEPSPAPALQAPAAEPARLREISLTATRTERDAADLPATPPHRRGL
jgi:hypothetical protein